jgi:spore germination cell wall hydrolase CwlJ-like protein
MSETDLFALCIWREASGEGHMGMLAVAWVIWNRTIRWKKTLTQVIMGPNQFTSMSVDKNPRNPGPGDPQYADAREIVAQVMAGVVQDPTDGTCYYANLAIATSGWFFYHIVNDAVNHPQVAEIGQHTFFK